MSGLRDLESASMNPEELYQGVGVLRVSGRNIIRSSFRLSRERFRAGASWRFIAYGDDLYSKSQELGGVGRPRLEFVGETESGRPIHVDPTFASAITRHRLEANPTSAFLGHETLSSLPERHRVHVELTPTPFAHPESDWLGTSFTGEIKAHSTIRKRRVSTAIPMRLGFARLILRYRFENCVVSGIGSLLRIPIPQIEVVVKSAARSKDVRSLMHAIGDDLQSALTVLSFLTRRHVRWYRMRHSARWQNAPAFKEGEWSRVIASTPNDSRRPPLVNANKMPADGVRRLIRVFEALPYKSAAAASITYLVASYDAAVVDSKLVHAFTAFEALVTGIDSSNGAWRTLPRSQYDRLRIELASGLETFASRAGISRERLSELKEKLTELQRRPIVERAIELLEADHVEWRDLWPPGVELRLAWKAAYKRRNQFLHSGSLPSLLQARVDAVRLRALTERLLLARLGADADWHDPLSFEEAQLMSAEHLASELGQF